MNRLFEYAQFIKELEEDLNQIYNDYYSDGKDNAMSREDFDRIIALDPTFKKDKTPESNKLGAYGKWLLTLFKKGEIKPEDEHEFTDQLGIFNSSKSKLPPDKRDIGRVKSLSELIELNTSMEERTSKSNFQLKAENVEGAKFIAKTDGWEIYQPLTYEASKFLRDDTSVNGYDANWCTGWHDTQRYWKQYTDRGGELFIFFNLNATNEKDAKYQVCIRDGRVVDFRDARDNSASWITFISDDTLFKALGSVPSIVASKDYRAVKYVKDSGGKITYSKLMGIKYLGANDSDTSDLYDILKKSVKIIIVDDGIKILPSGCFSHFNIEKIILPDSIQIIGSGCFASCKNLSTFKCPSSLKTLPTNCFKDCNSLKEVVLTDNIVEIKKDCFLDCSQDLKIISSHHKINVPSSDKTFILNHIEWKDVTESLKEEVLVEKFSGEMPDWFKKFISSNPEDDSLVRDTIEQLTKGGLNLETLKVIECPKPTKITDSFFSNQGIIPIFYITTNQINNQQEYSISMDYNMRTRGYAVYIKGINNPSIGYYAKDDADNMSNKKLMTITEKCAYIDLTDESNFIDKEKIQTRQDYNKFTQNDDRFQHSDEKQHYIKVKRWVDKNNPSNVREYKPWYNDNYEEKELSILKNNDSDYFDKSGYRIIGIKQSLIKRLNDLHKQNYVQVIENYKKDIEECKTKILNITQQYYSDINSIDIDSTDITALYDNLTSCISLYQKLLSRLDYILLLDDEDRKKQEIDKLFIVDNYTNKETYDSLRKKIIKLKNLIKSLDTSVIENYIGMPTSMVESLKTKKNK